MHPCIFSIVPWTLLFFTHERVDVVPDLLNALLVSPESTLTLNNSPMHDARCRTPCFLVMIFVGAFRLVG
ncbi:hypothetical protein ABKN59_002086 [Abortiporus biennis]